MLTPEDIQALSDDPAEMAQQLLDIAGGNATFRIDSFVGGTEELPFEASLALVGMRVTPRVGKDWAYIVDEDPAATPAQVALRDQWLAGTTSGAK